jgi:DNA-binding MarR family transcriptional regulator
MNYELPSPLQSNTILSLMRELSILLDNRHLDLRQGTRYENVRPSDIKVFVEVARQPRSESEIARTLDVSRQAVQSSVKRLVEMKIIEVVSMPNNGRNKIVQVTERGNHARAAAAEQIRIVEAECAAVIGPAELERLRGLLMHLTTGYKAAHFPNPKRTGS